jgi:hydrogenase nickel incorporation protein HypA/HybF
MHELAVAAEILDLARREARAAGARRVLSVRLRVGVASCLSPDSLAFGFEALARDTEAEGCRLDVERAPATFRCPACHHAGELCCLDDLGCPACGQHPVTLTGGRDLTVLSLEVD